MKALPLALAASLVVNVALVGLLTLGISPEQSQVLPAPPAPPTPSSSTHLTTPEPAGTTTPPGPLAADDFAGLSARLTAAGVSPHLTRLVVTYSIKQHFDRRRFEAGLSHDPASFARRPVTSATSESAEITAARAAMDREEREALQNVLGGDDNLSIESRRQIAGNLPAEKTSSLMKIVSDYRQMEAQLYLQDPNRGSPENLAKVALLQKERRADIERLLTPAELLEYDLRNSNAANLLRNRLGPFKVTETEFRALYAAFKQAEEAATAAGVPPRIRDRDPLIEPALRQVLGETRHADREREKQLEAERIRTFGATRQLTEKLGLPMEATNDLLILQADFRPRLAALQTARTATPEQREAQIAELSREAERKLTWLLGPEGYATYRAQMGQWLTANPAAPNP
ncbi:MAG: hypothetical protein V4773_19135 [Verrucomicrobiota bacterium]